MMEFLTKKGGALEALNKARSEASSATSVYRT